MKRLLFFSFFIFHFSLNQAQYHIYGLATTGGISGDGVIYRYNPNTNKDSVIFNFNGINGADPQSDFLQASDGLLYSLTEFGGAKNMGTLFSFNPKSFSENVLVSLDSVNGEIVDGGNNLLEATNGKIYGTVFQGGMYNLGILFDYDINTGLDSVLLNFASDSMAFPCRSMYQDTITKLIYGTTEAGGNGGGVLYKFNPFNYKDSILVNFVYNTSEPFGSLSGLMMASNGLLYSMALSGGDSNFGVIYSYNIMTRVLKTEFSFNGTNGKYPRANTLIQLSNGLIYGMTTDGGTYNKGVLFEFNPRNNSERVLFNFDGNNNGSYPEGCLLWDPFNNLLYGVTAAGGSVNDGVFFSYDTSTSTFDKIFDFTGVNGASSISGLIIVQDSEKITTGQTDLNMNLIKIYPNPNHGKFNMVIPNLNELLSIEVYNVLGEGVYWAKVNSNHTEINLREQPNGIYFYRVLKETGEFLGSGKLIIEK